jgi:type IX secretion system PorP/SprF family membrane protein
MIRNIPIVIILTFFTSVLLNGQQTPAWSSFYETGFVWNPALTARWSRAETSATFKREWTDFEGAPEYANLSYQHPFINPFTKTSIGFMVDYDRLGPFQIIGGKVTSTYRIRTNWFDNRRDVLSMGLGFGAQRYGFDPSKLVAFDGAQGDLTILPVQTWLNPDVSMGFYYCSMDDLNEKDSHYYFGAAINRIIPMGKEVILNSSIKTKMHVHIHGGYRYYPHRQSYFIEPSLFVSYAPLINTNVMASCRVEDPSKGWLAAGAVSNGEIFFQAGFILSGEGRLKKIIKDGNLRVGGKIDRQTINLGRYAGIGFELYTAYTFDMDNYNKW